MFTQLDSQDAKSFGLIAGKLEHLHKGENLTAYQREQISLALTTLDQLFIKLNKFDNAR